MFEIRDVLYVGESENYFVEIWSGKREEDYKFDGIANPLTPYFLIKIKAKQIKSARGSNAGIKKTKKLDGPVFKARYYCTIFL